MSPCRRGRILTVESATNESVFWVRYDEGRSPREGDIAIDGLVANDGSRCRQIDYVTRTNRNWIIPQLMVFKG